MAFIADEIPREEHEPVGRTWAIRGLDGAFWRVDVEVRQLTFDSPFPWLVFDFLYRPGDAVTGAMFINGVKHLEQIRALELISADVSPIELGEYAWLAQTAEDRDGAAEHPNRATRRAFNVNMGRR